MNSLEAHEYLEDFQRIMTRHREAYSEDLIEANGQAILALEKQTRKEPKYIDGDYDLPLCPSCGLSVDEDRLIELLKPHVSGTACLCESGSCELTSCGDCKARRLADYLLANGVIVLPCKVGDKIYCLFKHCDHTETEIIEIEIDTFEIHKDYTIINGYCGAHCYRYFTHEIGKTVFLTKEEAEKALAKRGKE